MMSLGETTAMVALAVAIAAHAAASIWWASKITTTVDGIGNTITSIKDEFKKRDQQMIAMWNKIDDSRERIIVLETKGRE